MSMDMDLSQLVASWLLETMKKVEAGATWRAYRLVRLATYKREVGE